MRITPASELQDRCRKLQSLMQENGMDAALLLQNSDLFYFTGSIQQGALYIPVSGEPIYMVRREYNRARMESGLKEIVPFKSPRYIPEILADFNLPLPEKMGMELDVVPVALFGRFQKVLPRCDIVDVSNLIRTVRSVKSHYEIEIMKDAALQTEKICQRAREVIRVGMTDIDLMVELEYAARQAGHQGLVRMRGFNAELFYGHVFSGPDSAVPAFNDTPLGGLGVNPAIGQGASLNRIAANQPIVVDLTGAFDGYLVDQTRIFCVDGLPEQLLKAYDDMVRVEQHAKKIALPGVAWGTVYDECHRMAVDMGYADHFMGSAGAQVSFIGHGIGIEIDEFPFIARGFSDHLLEENMTFAFEPKAVYPGLGAVGVENTFWVAKDGLKHITFSSEELVVL